MTHSRKRGLFEVSEVEDSVSCRQKLLDGSTNSSKSKTRSSNSHSKLEEELELIQSRISATNRIVEESRQSFLKTICGFEKEEELKFAEFHYQCDANALAHEMIQKFGHRTSIHDTRHMFYSQTIFLGMLQRLIQSAFDTFNIPVLQSWLPNGFPALWLEMFHAWLIGHCVGRKRSRPPEIMSGRILNCTGKYKKNPFRAAIGKELTKIIFEESYEVTSKESLVEHVRLLKVKYLCRFCRYMHVDKPPREPLPSYTSQAIERRFLEPETPKSKSKSKAQSLKAPQVVTTRSESMHPTLPFSQSVPIQIPLKGKVAGQLPPIRPMSVPHTVPAVSAMNMSEIPPLPPPPHVPSCAAPHMCTTHYPREAVIAKFDLRLPNGSTFKFEQVPVSRLEAEFERLHAALAHTQGQLYRTNQFLNSMRRSLPPCQNHSSLNPSF